VPALIVVLPKLLAPLRVSVLAPACTSDVPVMVLAIEIDWPELASLTKLGPRPLKLTALPAIV
jgi:hypothetical protein